MGRATPKVALKRTTLVLFLLVFAAAAVFAGGGKEAAPAKVRLNVGWTTEQAIETLRVDEAWELGDMGTVWWQLVYDQLWMIGPGPDYDVVPRLAKSWETEDRQTWIWHLVEDAKWHDGVPFTAEDVKFTLEYLIQAMEVWYRPDTDFEELTVIDDHTLKMKLKEAIGGDYPPVFWIPILPKHIFEPWKDDMFSFANDEAIGIGPFKLKEFKSSESMWLVKNEDYYGEKPHVDEIVFKTYGSKDAVYMAMKAGEIDMIGYYGASILVKDELEKSPNIEIIENPGLAMWPMNFNLHQKTAVRDRNFRYAVMHAIDRQRIIDLVYLGVGEPIDSMIYPELVYHNPNLYQFDYNPAKAREYLGKSGFVDTDGNGIVNDPANGKDVHLVMMVASGWVDTLKASTIARENLAEVGIDVEIKTVDINTFYDYNYKPEDDFFDLSWSEFDAGINFDWIWDYFQSYEGGGEGWNTSWYQNPGVDKLIDDMRTELDNEKRKQMIWELQEILIRDLPKGWMFRTNMIDPVSTRFEGYPEFMGGISSWINPWSYMKVRPRQ
jgi:peptide/nickel transport system substrate-binding protein